MKNLKRRGLAWGNHRWGMRVISSAILWLLVSRSAACEDPGLNKSVRRCIDKVRKARSSNERYDAAKAMFTKVSSSGASLDEATIHRIAELLEIRDDGARIWIAASLAQVGQRAKFAAPKLLSIVAEADCYMTETSSAESIRGSLLQIGVQPPPRAKCIEYLDPSTGKPLPRKY